MRTDRIKWGHGRLADDLSRSLPALLADEGMKESGALVDDAKVRAEHPDSLVNIHLCPVPIKAVDRVAVAFCFEIPKGPMNNHHERIA